MISKFIYTKILGWKIVGEFPHELKKYVVIGAPHTSWKDFPIAILARNTWGVKINFIGKKSLFKPPFGFIFRWLGGAPVDRSKSNNLVQSIVDIFDEKEEFRLALSPEGTRKKVEQWKTGFYFIAKGAGVPIIMFTLDFGRKQVAISDPYYPTDDMEKDFKVFHDFYKDVKGANPELF
ncbi:lysophospholipid acyltransferase family protein [Tenacibaculum sp. TC6]|uniref:lysophospholipid acyltransferase family protein n=1 Tax=Tenacibaculum sp. TC6 TaxID=3423223 RepID=UPI003D35BDD7